MKASEHAEVWQQVMRKMEEISEKAGEAREISKCATFEHLSILSRVVANAYDKKAEEDKG